MSQQIDDVVALCSLRPGVGFALRGEDIAGIEWHTDGVEPVTREQVDAEKARLTAEAV